MSPLEIQGSLFGDFGFRLVIGIYSCDELSGLGMISQFGEMFQSWSLHSTSGIL